MDAITRFAKKSTDVPFQVIEPTPSSRGAPNVSKRPELEPDWVFWETTKKGPDAVADGIRLLEDDSWGSPGERHRLITALAKAARAFPTTRSAVLDALKRRLAQTTDSYSTNSHFCLSVVYLIQAAALVIVED